MRFYKMRRYQQLVFRTTPDSLLDWLDCELEKRGIDCVYTHCILSILQEDSSDAEPDECIDGRNCHKVYRKLESLYSATKSKHQKWKSYSKQILLSTSIPCFDVDIDNREQKNKVSAINCLKSVSDDNTIEELIDEVCMKLKNIRNIVAPEKKESLKSSNKIDKDTAFYIPPSSPTDQVEKYFAAFPPLNKKDEERMDSIQAAHLNICYANCIRQSKNIVQDIFINNNSFQNSENSKHKQGFGSLKSIENIYQPENINKTLKCKNSQPSDHNANNFKFTDENGYAGTSFRNSAKFDKNSSVAVMNSDRNRDTNIQNCSEKSCIKISRSKNVSQKPRKNGANKSNYRSEKEPDSKRKSLLNAKMYSNAKKAKNSTESYFSSNKFSVLMEEETCKLDIDLEEHNENVIINHSLKSEKKVEAFELITNPCKKFKICKNSNVLVDTFNDSTIEKEVADSTSSEMSLSCLPKYNCDKELICKNNSCLEEDLTLEMHAEKRKSYENNLFEEVDGIASCKKLSTRTKYFKSITKAKRKKSKSKPKDINNKSNFDVPRYSDKDHYSEGAIKGGLRDMKDSALKLCDKREGCFQSETENLYTSKILLHMPEFFLKVKKKDSLSISCLMKMRENINTEQSMCSFFKIDRFKKNPIIFSEKNKIETSQNSNKAPTVTKEISFNNINDSSQGSLYIPLDSKKVGQQNFTFALANINSIIIENNTYYKFNAFKALNHFSPHEIFNIITTGDSNEVNNFLNKFSVQSNFNSYPNSDTLLPDKNVSENFPSIDLKVSGSLPLMKHSSSHLQSIFAPKEQSAPIFNIGFQSVEFKDETFYETECSKDSLPFCYAQQNMVESKNNTPAIFGQWNYNLFLDLSDESPNLSNNGSKCNNLNTKTSIAVSDKEIAFMFPNKLVLNENDCSFCPSEQFNSVKSKNSIWNIDNRDMFNNYTTLSTSLICKNNFSETHFSYSGEICPESKFVCLLKNADDAVSLESISCFSSPSAFENVQKKELPCKTHSSVRCQQNLLKKVTNIDRIIHRINAQNRVVSFLNAHTSVKQPLDDRAKTFLHSFSPDSPSNSYKDGISIDDFLSFNCGIAKNDLSSNYNVNLGWSKKCTNSDESLRAIWENNSNPVSIKENNYKPVVTEGIYTLFDNFDLESMQNDLEREEDELLKTMYSVSDSKEKNEQIMPNLKFKSSYSLKTNSKNESLELNVEEFPGISVPMSNISAKTTSKISDCSNFDFTVSASDVDPVGVFSIDNCMNIIDSQATCSDTSYSLNVKDEAYQHSGFIDVSAFRGPYGSYSENKTNYLEGGGWSLDSGDFMLGSDAFHYRSSSLHELEITDAENDSFQHEHSDQQHLSSKDSETAQLNTTRLPFANARRRMKHKFPTYKRPCAFFMEGNCSRSDCKYSHDLSNITCRFWTEGSCFKGTTCPFLHGYVEYQKIDHHNYSKSEPKNYYSLDSEADFPSLSSAKCEKTVAAKSLPVDIVCAKRVKNSNLGN